MVGLMAMDGRNLKWVAYIKKKRMKINSIYIKNNRQLYNTLYTNQLVQQWVVMTD